MALAETLSAMRQLILDPIDLPSDQPSRQALYRERFPKLSELEVEDLSKMEPSRLGLYSSSIFSAEGSIIRNNFALSYALIAARWGEVRGGELTPARLARAVHVAAPWRGLHSDSLGESLYAFVTGEGSDLLAVEPSLAEAVRFEIAVYRVKKGAPESYPPQRALDRGAIAAMTVDDLMAQPVYTPALLCVFESEFNIRSARALVLKDRSAPPAPVEKKNMRIAGARPADYGVEWLEVSHEMAELLLALRGKVGAEMGTVGDLASAFLSSGEFESEEAAFVGFLETLSTMVEYGIVSVNPSR